MDYNKCVFIGKVADKPKVREQNGSKQVFFDLIVNDRVQGANKQWVDKPINIPIFASEKKADIIAQYVATGQELLLECKYQAWKDGNGTLRHTFTVYNVLLGFKPRSQGDAAASDIGEDMPPM